MRQETGGASFMRRDSGIVKKVNNFLWKDQYRGGTSGACTTFFQVNDGKSTPSIGSDYAASGEATSHLGSFLTFQEIGATLL